MFESQNGRKVCCKTLRVFSKIAKQNRTIESLKKYGKNKDLQKDLLEKDIVHIN